MKRKYIDIGNNQFYVKRFIEKYININHLENSATFISARWGKGKTTFIEKIIEELTQIQNTNRIKEGVFAAKHKCLIISVWEEDWENKFFATLTRKAFPISYYILNLGIPMVSVFLTGCIIFFQKQLNNFNFNDWWTILFIFIISLFTVVSIEIKGRNKEILYSYILKFRLSRYKKREWSKEFAWLFNSLKLTKLNIQDNKIIFFIEDIDRLNRHKLEQVYSNLSRVNAWHNCQIIVTGDYDLLLKLYGSNELESDIFLQKVINRIVHLPIEYYSSNVWDKTIAHFIAELNEKNELYEQEKKDIELVESVFTSMNKTIREAIHFIDLLKLNEEKITSNHINIGEFIILAFIYQFYFPLYEWIKENPNRFIKSYNLTSNKTFDLKEKEEQNTDEFQYLFTQKFSFVIEEEVSQNSLLLNNEFLELLDSFKKSGNNTLPIRAPYFKSSPFKYYAINTSVDEIKNLNNEQFQKLFKEEDKAIDIFDYIYKNDLYNDLNLLMSVNFLKSYNYENTIDINAAIRFINNFIKSMNKYNQNFPSDDLYFKFNKISAKIIYQIDDNQLEKINNSVIITNKNLDLSQKLALSKLFIDNLCADASDKHLKIITQIFNYHKEFKIIEQKYPKLVFHIYFNFLQHDVEIKRNLEKVFELSNNNFFTFIENHLLSEINATNYLSNFSRKTVLIFDFKNLFNNNSEFISKLNNRISELDKNHMNKLNSYIENLRVNKSI